MTSFGMSTVFNILIMMMVVTGLILILFQMLFIFRFKHFQRRYSRAILATNAGVWEWFPRSKKFYVSSEFAAQFGMNDRDSISNMEDWLSILRKEDRRTFEEWSRCVLEQKKQEATTQLLRLLIDDKKGDSAWVEIRGNITSWDSKGRVNSIAGTLEKIDHIVKSESELIKTREESRRRELILSSLLDSMPDPIWLKDDKCRYMDCNQAYLKFNGLCIDDVVGKDDIELNTDSQGEHYLQTDKKVLNEGTTFHEVSRGVAADGSGERIFEVAKYPILESSLNFKGILGVARDVTERYSLISELQLFKSFADNSGQGFAMATLDGDLTYLNQKMRELLSVTDDVPIQDINFLAFYPPKTQEFIQQTVFPYVKEYGVWEGELQALTMDGGIRETRETFFILHDKEGEPILFGDIMNDIGEQKMVSSQLEKAKEAAEEASSAKSNFLANMSHEIRTPLNAIIGYAQLLREEANFDAETQVRFQSIVGAGERLLGLVNDILDIARIESGRMILHGQKVHLEKEIQQVVKLLQGQAHGKGLALTMTLNMREELLVWLDPVKFHQILTNLIGNAIKFTSQGAVDVTAYYEDDLLQLTVSDTGPGIEPSLMDRLFTPFVQGNAGEKEGGTGLGLALSNTLVKLMGGSLSVESELGKGTQISVMLPISDMTEESDVENAKMELGAHMRLSHPVTVLVAEDDEWSRDILVSLLEKAGCLIIEAEDGAIAMEAFLNQKPDIVMTDIRMPNKTGQDLLKFIQEQDPEKTVPVVAITASTLIHEQKELLEDGFWQVISKPYKVEKVYEALVAHIDVTFVPIHDKDFSQSASALSSAQNEEDITLSSVEAKALEPLMRAAQSGDLTKTEDELNSLVEKLTCQQHQLIREAFDQFDLERIEEMIIQSHPDLAEI